MFEIDHIAVWAPDRDAVLARISDALDLPVREGFAPDGRLVARGVRFCNGPFLDIHQAPEVGGPLLGLRGNVAAAEALAARQGWRVKRTATAMEPWTILAFRRGQGVLSRLFVIEYHSADEIAASPAFGGGLYHLPPTAGPELARVWLSTTDTRRAGANLEALGFAPTGEVDAIGSGLKGRLYRGHGAALVLCDGADAILRADVSVRWAVDAISVGPSLTLVAAPEAYRRSPAQIS